MFLDEQISDKATPGYTAILLNLGVKCVSRCLAAAGKGEHHTKSHHAVVRCVKTQSDTPPICTGLASAEMSHLGCYSLRKH